MLEITFLRGESKSFIHIEHEVLSGLLKFRQISKFDLESGGVLQGEYRGDHILINGFTTPGIDDKRSRFRFFRRSTHHKKKVKDLWIKSNKTNCWIGDWHTHPETLPTPSKLDIDSWRKNFHEYRPMFGVIIGIEGLWLGEFFNGKLIWKKNITD